MIRLNHIIATICFLVALFDLKAQLPQDFRSEQIVICPNGQKYEAGDSIDVQGKVICRSAHNMAAHSKYLYIELISQSDSLIARHKVSCKQDGYFSTRIGIDPLLSPGVYYLRAYTNLMRNFNSKSFCEQPVLVDCEYPDFSNIISESDDVRCSILPHGGHLVSGALQHITTRLANNLNDPIGDTPIHLLNADGDTITSGITSPSGLAMLSFVPENGMKYSIATNIGNVSTTFPLPAIDDSKPLLQASMNGTLVTFRIIGKITDCEHLRLYAYDSTNGISRLQTASTSGSFRLNHQPQLLTLFLTDADNNVLAQASTIPARQQRTPLDIKLPKQVSAGKPLSISIDDKSATVITRLLPSTTRWTQHAESQLYYLSDIQSPIPFPERYFELSPRQQTAELMAWIGTASFIRFNLKEAIANNTAIYRHLPEDVIVFNGTVTRPSQKVFGEGTIVAYNTETNSPYYSDIDGDGRFHIAVDDFTDGTQFFLQPADRKNVPQAMIVDIDDDTFPATEVSKHYTLSKNRYAKSEVTYTSRNYHNQQLPEITVKARTHKNDVKTTERFYGNSYKSQEMIDQRNYRNLYDIIKDMPGLYISVSEEEMDEDMDDTNSSNTTTSLWQRASKAPKATTRHYAILSTRGHSTLSKKAVEVVVLIDGSRTPEPVTSLMNMDAKEIESVEYLRPWQALTYTFGALNGAINITTRRYKSPDKVKTKGTFYTPLGITPRTAAAATVADTPGEYRLLVDIIAPDGVRSYESSVMVTPK